MPISPVELNDVNNPFPSRHFKSLLSRHKVELSLV